MKTDSNGFITQLDPNEVFVFGSNEAGIHGAGAARTALDKFGATWGIGFGLSHQSFAIPTKDIQLRTLPLGTIHWYIQAFKNFTRARPDLTFYVTPIGTGLAGIPAVNIAPLFVFSGPNVVLPNEFL